MCSMCHIATFCASCHSGFELQVQHPHQGHPTLIETAETSRQGLGMTKPQITNKMNVHLQASSLDKQITLATCAGQTKMQPTRSGVIIFTNPNNALLGNPKKTSYHRFPSKFDSQKNGKSIVSFKWSPGHPTMSKKTACLIIKRVVT